MASERQVVGHLIAVYEPGGALLGEELELVGALRCIDIPVDLGHAACGPYAEDGEINAERTDTKVRQGGIAPHSWWGASAGERGEASA
jgi:hypothetical protein